MRLVAAVEPVTNLRLNHGFCSVHGFAVCLDDSLGKSILADSSRSVVLKVNTKFYGAKTGRAASDESAEATRPRLAARRAAVSA
jgi:hypothetical protein